MHGPLKTNSLSIPDIYTLYTRKMHCIMLKHYGTEMLMCFSPSVDGISIFSFILDVAEWLQCH